MLSILFLYHLVRFSHAAVALPIQFRSTELLDATVSSSTCPDLNHCRTLWDIIWSCLVTMFTCTWLAVHPNIPAPGEGFIRININRAKIMVVGLLAPELIILWAMRQWFMAHLLAKKYERYGWTQTHGFFALMGGFTILNNDGRRHPILLSNLEKYLVAGNIRITKEEIEDKSKGDILSKGIVLVQTTWFILQLIARAIERLPTSELELVALAFAALNFATYGVWWNKPLDVQYPVVLMEATAAIRGCAVLEIDQGLVSPPENPHVALSGPRRTLRHRQFTVIFRSPVVCIKQVAIGVTEGIVKAFDNLVDVGTGYDFEDFFVRMQRVPTFYWGVDMILDYKLHWSYWRNMHGIVTLVATTFGAIHCIAWTFHMPTESEKVLWRTVACFTTVAPLPYAVGIGGFIAGRLSVQERISRRSWSKPLLWLIICGPVLLYIVSRVTLLIQAFVLLRELPAGAYTTVQWTTFIPHI